MPKDTRSPLIRAIVPPVSDTPILAVLDGRWQSTADIKLGLIKNCGWDRQAFGPKPHVEQALERLAWACNAEGHERVVNEDAVCEWRARVTPGNRPVLDLPETWFIRGCPE